MSHGRLFLSFRLLATTQHSITYHPFPLYHRLTTQGLDHRRYRKETVSEEMGYEGMERVA